MNFGNISNTKIIKGKDCVINSSEMFKKYGSKALIVTGKRSAYINGSLNDVKEALDKVNIEYATFSDVEENPSVNTVLNGGKFGREERCDFVIGIGGGSPMDAAKGIALSIKNPEIGQKELYDKTLKLEALPVLMIPTTCGTGSEVTGVAVISVPDKRTKCSLPHRIFPEVAFLDAKYLLSASRKIIEYTSIDALGHIYESYINKGVTDDCKRVGLAGLELFAEVKGEIFGGGEYSFEALDKMLLSSNYAGLAIKVSGTSAPHALSYRQTFEFGIAHGKAIGHFQPGYLKYAVKEDRDILIKTAGFKDFDEFEEFIGLKCSFDEAPSDKILEIKLKSVDEIMADEARINKIPYKVDRDIMLDIAGIKK